MSASARRLSAAGALAIIVVCGLVVHALPGSAVTDIAGDALYACAAYALIVALAPGLRPRVVSLIAVAWCFAIEFLQLTSIPGAVAGVVPPARLVLGSGFDPRDLLVYGAAALVAGLVDAGVTRAVRSRRAAPRPR
ncbi:DUF2809 domain-containing protein [Microbacterium candidum]|uniref:DUF2809 domain-containing protein n=1 Tax=Microbacterium candidum TaxID=3041922 RepID=A0ABT7N488_9MICO|nr:DUF2809 domain-containing protein [Microbacterium sp. ASV49]MDL9981531.1 DUF2809 domain-containing protein [Microbacterium sp. ASV49]